MMHLSCMFNYEQCKAEDFSWEFDSNYGNCYSFNSGFNSTGHSVNIKKPNIAGDGYGLSLEIYTNYYENLSYYNSFMGGRGLLIRIDNVSHSIDFAKDGILVTAGSLTNIALRREFKASLPQPYSNCDFELDKSTYFNSDLFKLIQISPIEYTQQFCLNQCLQQLLVRECNCVFSFFKSVFNASSCSATSVYCAIKAYSSIFIAKDYVKTTCLPQCPLECSSTKYLYTLSSYDLVGNSYVDDIEMNGNLSLDFVTRELTPKTSRQSVARLSIFYDSLSYTTLEESPQLDFVTLIANIGGNLGLFLGMSLYSIGEFITALFEVYFFFKNSPKINNLILQE